MADRETAIGWARNDTDRAQLEARAIEDPWYACQALSWTARFASNNRFESIIREAMDKASECDDLYRRVAVSAWPIRAMLECGREDLVQEYLPGLLLTSRCVIPPSSRSEALFLLFQALRPGRRDVWAIVLESLIAASIPIEHWRQGRNLEAVAAMVLNEDIAVARRILNRVEEGRTLRRIGRIIDSNRTMEPRKFFW